MICAKPGRVLEGEKSPPLDNLTTQAALDQTPPLPFRHHSLPLSPPSCTSTQPPTHSQVRKYPPPRQSPRWKPGRQFAPAAAAQHACLLRQSCESIKAACSGLSATPAASIDCLRRVRGLAAASRTVRPSLRPALPGSGPTQAFDVAGPAAHPTRPQTAPERALWQQPNRAFRARTAGRTSQSGLIQHAR